MRNIQMNVFDPANPTLCDAMRRLLLSANADMILRVLNTKRRASKELEKSTLMTILVVLDAFAEEPEEVERAMNKQMEEMRIPSELIPLAIPRRITALPGNPYKQKDLRAHFELGEVLEAAGLKTLPSYREFLTACDVLYNLFRRSEYNSVSFNEAFPMVAMDEKLAHAFTDGSTVMDDAMRPIPSVVQFDDDKFRTLNAEDVLYLKVREVSENLASSVRQ